MNIIPTIIKFNNIPTKNIKIKYILAKYLENKYIYQLNNYFISYPL